MPVVSVIAAVAENFAIGKDQKLLCHLPNDMKRFKELTVGHTVIMGRHTFESLPKGALPQRRNIVITSMPEVMPGNVFPSVSPEAAMLSCATQDQVFVIGGSMVYDKMLPMADRLYLTFVHHAFEDADTYFPEIDFSQWEEVSREDHEADERHAYSYSFVDYVRKER